MGTRQRARPRSGVHAFVVSGRELPPGGARPAAQPSPDGCDKRCFLRSSPRHGRTGSDLFPNWHAATAPAFRGDRRLRMFLLVPLLLEIGAFAGPYLDGMVTRFGYTRFGAPELSPRSAASRRSSRASCDGGPPPERRIVGSVAMPAGHDRPRGSRGSTSPNSLFFSVLERSRQTTPLSVMTISPKSLERQIASLRLYPRQM